MVFHPVTELVEYLDSGVWFETGMDFSSVWNVEFDTPLQKSLLKKPDLRLILIFSNKSGEFL